MAKSKVVSFSDASAYNNTLNKIAKETGLSWVRDRAESPIEKILGYELVLEALIFRGVFSLEDVTIGCQDEFKFGDKKYRADLVVYVQLPGGDRIFVIECDGHDFHEKTKEQAQRDKSRDRAFMRNGITVIRFTGSEIYKDVKKCIEETFRIIEREVVPENLWIRNAWCKD